MRRFFILLFCGILVSGCKSKPINQTIGKKKEGMWVENYEQDSIKYKSVEHYKNDAPVKKWKTYIDEKIYKTENYRNGTSMVKNYYKNGELQSKGQTRIEIDSIETHWFYDGVWKFYSEKGKLTAVRKYSKGKLISEREIK